MKYIRLANSPAPLSETLKVANQAVQKAEEIIAQQRADIEAYEQAEAARAGRNGHKNDHTKKGRPS